MKFIQASPTGVPLKVWLEDVDEGTLEQARNVAALPYVFGWVALMPDAHSGYGMPIGGVLATQDIVVPNAVGVDIGCGVALVGTDLSVPDPTVLTSIREEILQRVPVGFSHHQKPQTWSGFDLAPLGIQVLGEQLESARYQLGTLGGGNHFIELQADEEDRVYVMVHSGSRNFGLKVAKFFHEIAKELCSQWHVPLPTQDLAYLPASSAMGKQYITAMEYCLQFAQASRAHMLQEVCGVLRTQTGALPGVVIDVHHNYAALEHHYGKNLWVHRKGATRARKGDLCLIPGSMGTSSYVVEGLGQAESFTSCSHGAGRRMGRKEAERSLELEQEQKKMGSIIHGLSSVENLDEAPGAYKDIEDVMRLQQDLVRIKTRLRPLVSIKG